MTHTHIQTRYIQYTAAIYTHTAAPLWTYVFFLLVSRED